MAFAYYAGQIWSSGVSLKRFFKMQFRHSDLRSIWPPSQKLWTNLIFAQFRHCNYNWGGLAVQRKRDIFGKNAFSGISFYWPQDQESTLCNMNFRKNGVFVKHPNGHQAITKKWSLTINNRQLWSDTFFVNVFPQERCLWWLLYKQPPSHLSNWPM